MRRLLVTLAVLAAACGSDSIPDRYTGDQCVDLPDIGKVCGYNVIEICKKADGVPLTSGDCMIDGELWEFTGG